MATLESLLALLPDNTTGQISAADMRDIVSALWMNDEALLGAVNSISPTDGEASVVGTWQVNPDAGATPGTMQVACDTGAFATATELYFAQTDQTGTDMSVILAGATSLYGQQQIDATKWVRMNVNGAVTVAGGVVTVPVEVIGTSPAPGSPAWQNAVVVIRTTA